MKADELEKFQEQLGYHFHNPSLLELAMVHRSLINEAPDSPWKQMLSLASF